MLSTHGYGAYNRYNQPQSRQTSGDLSVMYVVRPEWQAAMQVAQKCLASISINGRSVGSGVFMEKDVLMVPRHLLMNRSSQLLCGSALKTHLENIQVLFNDDKFCYFPVNVVTLLEDGGEYDYCLLKLESKLPGTIPQVTFGENNENCLFASVENGSTMITIVEPCHTNSKLMCNPEKHWTSPGSSGGVYLDQSGQLIGMHISQSTGKCSGHTGRERKMLLVNEVKQHSRYLCTLDKGYTAIELPRCLNPVVKDRCYIEQADFRYDEIKKNGDAAKGYQCKSLELHLSNAERGIQITIVPPQSSQKVKGNSTTEMSVKYQLFLIDNAGQELPNIHGHNGCPSPYNKKTVPKFYKTITLCVEDALNANRGIVQQEFDFLFEKTLFRARKYV